ncbi:hypothetical protein KI688_012225 [Linnemannia hyalina]|uniref:Uncharacterized protein n=1 Tax=Linnemannia hyalina TaxID=64524 RepID=A0A9P7XUN1_9FUNG|nr:hypothetical protein KI688_012225 [Linnemannia hyalina]
MTSTAGSWSNLFHGLPNRTPASNLYTEEAIQNEQLTADELIEKAQGNASLLVEMVAAISADDSHETLKSFNNNDIIQTLHKQCQEMSDYLYERIWHDSGDSGNTNYRGYDNSSSASVQNKTVEEEAQIAAFISCNEQIQAAFKRYEELKDHLQAKQMQEEEIARSRGYNVTEASLDDVDDYTGGPSASEAVAQAFGARNDDDDDDETSDFVNGISIAGHDARQIHLRKSEQPLVWRLDPREDFKANKNKNKKWIDPAEKDRQERERMLERSPRNGIHGLASEPEPLEITPEVETVQATTIESAVVTAVEAEGSQPAQSTEPRAVLEATHVDDEEEEDYGIEKIQNRIVVVEEEDSEDEEEAENVVAEEDEDEGVLSDDSWEEIPDQGVVNLAISDDQDVMTSSSSSPFLLTPANGGSSPNPGASSSSSIPMPHTVMREI